MSLLEKIRKNSTIKEASILSESKFFTKKDCIKTSIPALNVALSGEIDGGFLPGLTLWCGPSKHFKSMFSLIMAKAYMDKYPEAVCVFFDCEYGTPEAYFTSLGMDTSRIYHIPILNMEEFKFEVMTQLQNISRGDRVIFIVDSLGNMASKKEMEDAIEGKSVQDMSRAKQMKSIFRMITPYLVKYDIPMVAVNHIYMEQGCLAGDTLVQTLRGSVPIKEIVVGDKVLTNNGVQDVEYCYTPSELSKDGKKFLRVHFDDGTSVECTDNHKFLTPENAWVPAGEFSEGTLLK